MTTGTTLTSLDALVAAGLVAAAEVGPLTPVAERYAVAVTPAMAALMDPADPADPIARQFLPRREERDTTSDERADPIGDHAFEVVPGLIHRYPDRALLKVLHACPVYCRFCFRREMVGPGGAALSGPALDRALGAIAERPAIQEVILTGGDPFLLSARRAAMLTARLAAMPHVEVLRWHTRVPVVAPERVTPALVRALRAEGAAVYVGIHANHPRELTAEARAAIGRLADAGLVLLSQTVLLRGVNDDVETLSQLFRQLVALRVRPYYLHHPDPAPGTGHFRLSIAEGQALVRGLRGRLSGLAQPAYVLDIPGGHGKVPIGPSYLEGDDTVRDWRGNAHPRPP